MRRPVLGQRRQRLAAARVGVVEDRRRRTRRHEIHRQHVGRVARRGIAVGNRVRLLAAGIRLEEPGVEQAHHRDVEPVQPHRRRVAHVAMVVIGPRRREDEVARVHRRALAVHGGVGAGRFQHEPDRRLRVPMAMRDLARQDQLQAGIEASGRPRLPPGTGVFQDQDPALGLLRRQQPARLQQQRPHVVVAPHHRQGFRRRLGRDDRGQHLPQRRGTHGADAVVELAPLGRDLGLDEIRGLGGVHG